jgi:hypothetical protein
VLDGEVLEKQRREFASQSNKDLSTLIAALSKKADRVVKEGKTYSVTTKRQRRPAVTSTTT